MTLGSGLSPLIQHSFSTAPQPRSGQRVAAWLAYSAVPVEQSLPRVLCEQCQHVAAVPAAADQQVPTGRGKRGEWNIVPSRAMRHPDASVEGTAILAGAATNAARVFSQDRV